MECLCKGFYIHPKCPIHSLGVKINIDLDQEAWKTIKKAASNSLWMPDNYTMNDWVSDVCNFLRYGQDS